MRFSAIPVFVVTAFASGHVSAADPAAVTDDPGGYYLGARLGWNHPIESLHEMDVDTYALGFDDRLYGGIYAGRYLGGGFRGELGLDYLRFDASHAIDEATRGVTSTAHRISGGTDALALTASLWRDLPRVGPATPYFGLGAGLAWTSLDATIIPGPDDPEFFEGQDLSAVGVAGAGLRFGLGPRTSLDLGYRFHSIIGARGEEQLNPDDPSGLQFSIGHYTSHLLFAGLDYRFGDTAPAAAPAPVNPWYIGGYAGGAWTAESHISEDHGENGSTVFDNPELAFGLVAGTEIAPGLRGEFELGFVRSVASYLDGDNGTTARLPYDGRFDQTFALLNLWQDFGDARFRPYAGGGLGYAAVRYDVDGYTLSDLSYDGTAHVFAGQFGAGLRYDVTNNLTMDLGYRMKGAIGALFFDNENDFAQNTRGTLYSHNLKLGATYTFGENGPMSVPADYGNGYWSAGLGSAFELVGELMEDSSHPVYFDPPVILNLAYGRNFTPNARAEIEFGYLYACADKTRDDEPDDPYEPVGGHVTQLSVMTNFWADFDLGALQPYVGGGVGMAMVRPQWGNGSENYYDGFNPALALQAGIGLRRELTDRLTLDIGYRYRAAIDAFAQDDTDGITDPGTVTYEAHAVQTSLAWKFGP